jgi:hypothetical protein
MVPVTGIVLLGLLLIAGMTRVALSQGPIVVTGTPPDACTDCITITPTVTLGTDDDRGFLTASGAVAMDSLGRYWVAQMEDGIKVFGSDGQYERMYGRAGRGPGEFGNPFVMISRHDTVHIFDTRTARHTVVTTGFRILHESSFVGPVFSVAVMDSGGVALNIASRLPQLIGLPIHLVPPLGGEIIRSFGADSAEYFNARASWPGRRALAPGGGMTVWVARRQAYRLQLWDTATGRKRREIVRDVDWFEPYDDWLALSKDRLPFPYIEQIYRDDAGRLWVLVTIGDPGWADHLEPYILPDGRNLPQPASWDGVYDTIVEVFDPDSGKLLATQRIPVMLIGHVEGDLVISRSETPKGGFQLRVWRMALTQP